MNNLKDMVLQGHQSFAEDIKLLLYKFDETIFTKLDFEQDHIYTDPLFFAIFNNNKEKCFSKKETKYFVAALVFGYTQNETLKKEGCLVKTDQFGRIYLPTKGWFQVTVPNAIVHIKYVSDHLEIFYKEEALPYLFDPTYTLKGTTVEILQYPHPLLQQFFPQEIYHEIDFEQQAKAKVADLERAFAILKKYSRESFELINTVLQKVIVFDIDADWTNSFMSRSAYGAAFLNAYQGDYNEVFFIEDIAHQVGHVTFEALVYQREKFFQGDYNEVLDRNEYEDRTIEVYFHALFTYHLILNSLSATLENNLFQNDLNKEHEMKGRLLFSMGKCEMDLDKVDASKAVTYFTEDGMEIYNIINDTYQRTLSLWGYLEAEYSLFDQPYNFTYEIFLEKNPIDQSVMAY